MPAYRLVSFDGAQSFELPDGKTIVVGRGVMSDVAVHDPTISRRHAELTATADGVQVKDLSSSNGTCVNGARLKHGRMTAGDSITFGKVLFQLEEMRAPLPERPVQAMAAVPADTNGAQPPGTIVREVRVSGGAAVGVGLTSEDRPRFHPARPGRLRVAATDQEERTTRKLSLLLDISQKLSAELDLTRLLGTVADMTFEVMNVDRVSILLLNDAGELVPTVSRSRLGDAEFQRVPRSIARKVVDERVAVLSHNAATDSRFTGNSIMLQSVRSAMCSPLMASADRVLGILYVDNLTDVNSFTDEDLQFLVAFSGLAAIGIKNSRYAEQIQREAMVRSNFERYFAPNVAQEIAQQQGAVKLGGEKRPITVLFSDIRGFTTMSESMSPDEIARLLTDYFSEMVEVIFEHGGTLDKFIGDAMMALWGAPIAHVDDPDRALRAAVAMQRALSQLNASWSAAGRPTVDVGIGINYGEVFAGNIGSHRRLEYTVIGDAVNIAARLCSRAGPGDILVSDTFRTLVTDPHDFEWLPEMTLKGKLHAVPVYRVRP
ncbi:MAG: FHA domain-containing protein [Gemmatimonadales bacterium]|nr:FHA domain-containing protein [Gemmatimonadales bacterium]